VPLFVHPVDPPGKDRTSDYELTVVAGYPFDSTINVFRMICSNFLDRYGDLKLVIAHTGAFSLMLRNRMQREVDTNATLSHSLPRKVGDYLRGLYFDTVCFEPDYLRMAAGIVPPSSQHRADLDARATALPPCASRLPLRRLIARSRDASASWSGRSRSAGG